MESLVPQLPVEILHVNAMVQKLLEVGSFLWGGLFVFICTLVDIFEIWKWSDFKHFLTSGWISSSSIIISAIQLVLKGFGQFNDIDRFSL